MSTLGMLADVIWAVFTLILAWRVWRLEGRARSIEKNADWLFSCIQERSYKFVVNQIAEDSSALRASVHALARALGYERKRTEAKEGWERKPAAYEDMRVSPSWGCVSPFSSVSRACSEKVDADVMALLKRRKTDHEPTADRRNGERRKPAPKKKPRRVTR